MLKSTSRFLDSIPFHIINPHQSDRLSSKRAKDFLSDEGVDLMEWPPQNPDLNPIEDIWKITGDGTQRRNLKNQDESWE